MATKLTDLQIMYKCDASPSHVFPASAIKLKLYGKRFYNEENRVRVITKEGFIFSKFSPLPDDSMLTCPVCDRVHKSGFDRATLKEIELAKAQEIPVANADKPIVTT